MLIYISMSHDYSLKKKTTTCLFFKKNGYKKYYAQIHFLYIKS
jgi:hypothetical protein